jgi:hypothetical protein
VSETKEGNIGRACSTHGREQTFYILTGKREEKRLGDQSIVKKGKVVPVLS